ncbi:hypothetical protein EN749_05085 [Mesorhizobium sp. M7A.F.Ca.ET.027.02.1.1]|uniref:phage major tropism determinant n=1 Tax=Mesorhizobium sp. M7A.F.Ca.ET.027.02.1.1 TaxID=2496655 RepID=UPI000FD5E7CC|nr:hypothetical protein [Mesorhizobium sp. M7A.F.Ca.ET.027.02.1.1]RVD18433.1 hypothetical protein EN749_05085 [Mesorhizobium sp. M7A.F.Ca.ET.027.02.1.1]
MNATAKIPAIGLDRADLSTSIFVVTGTDAIAIKAGTVVTIAGAAHAFELDTAVDIVDPAAGRDYCIFLGSDGKPRADICDAEMLKGDILGGFHFAPSGNATARAGGDGIPAINPFSCWDLGFRPACPDPRGMALIDGRFWADIYLLGTDHLTDGTSRFGQIIADGRSLPVKIGGEGRYKKLDYATAGEIYTHHGKGMLSAEEFFAAAYGVSERTSRDKEPETTGDVSGDGKKFVSGWGLFDVTGTMWQWGTDGDPDNPRASIFGGSWFTGSEAGSRYANLGYWPVYSTGHISARGRSDHLKPAA